MRNIPFFLGLLVVLQTGLAQPLYAQQPLAVDEIIPSAHLPAEAVVNTSNNNLDVIEHQNEIYLAWRTSRSHFASNKTLIQVLRKAQHEQQWHLETSIATGKDLREPRFMSLNGELYLYMAELGTNPLAFEPGRTLLAKRNASGQWGETREVFTDGFIPWRIHWNEGRPLMIGYRGGENIYQGDQSKGLRLYVMTTDNGDSWRPAFGGDGMVLQSGVSETDFAFTDTGLVAVGRNEAGDADGWGSKICRAYYSDLSKWECQVDRRKFDSPLLINNGDDVYLVARRQVANKGRYDLGLRLLDTTQQNALYQVVYSLTPKRCALWKVDASQLAVSWIQDLPSAGDTCFPSAIEIDDNRFDIYNYTSDYEKGAQWPWLKGQLSPTKIYKVTVDFSEFDH